MDTACPQCHQKDDLINKYLKLIKLLKTKCQKSAKSSLKNNTLSSDTLYETSLENSETVISNLKSHLIKSSINPEKVMGEEKIKCQMKLSVMVLGNRMRKTLLKQSFCAVKQWVNSQAINNQFGPQNQQLTISDSIHVFIQETLIHGKSLQLTPPIPSLKPLHQQILHLQLKNDQLTKNLTLLQQQLQQSEKRLFKQTQKKRETLETFGQEIRQKTQAINELKYTIKQYQRMIGKKVQENVLDENLEQVKGTCYRLEKINERLNDMVKRLQDSNEIFKEQIKMLKLNNTQFKQQNKCMKEKIFDMSHEISQKQKFSYIYSSMINKLNQKLESLKLTQKNLLTSMKKTPLFAQQTSPFILNSKIVSTKNTDLSNDDINTNQNKISMKQRQTELKLEEIFAFLFNIKQKGYKIVNQDIFDRDEKELLNSHKEIFLGHVKENSFVQMNRKLLKKNSNLDESQFRQTDEVFFSRKIHLQNPQNPQDDSLFCAFDTQKPLQSLTPIQDIPNNTQIKLIQLQIEKSKLVQKISQLKNLHMHIRNVILNFMKSIDLTDLKPETGSILELLFEFFQYSEDQKADIFKQKKKKFWGLL